MRLRVIWTGKTRDAHLKALIDNYQKRLSHFVKCEIVEMRESSGGDKSGIDKDSRRISDGLHESAINVLLAPDGTEWTSTQLAEQVQRWQENGTKEVAFIIGGPAGVSKELASRVDRSWSLSRLTLTHELARVLLMEQLYRAYTIIHGLPYQK